MKKYILSPCGTSLLTNSAPVEHKSLIFKNANKKSKAEVDEKTRNILENLISEVSEKLRKADNQTAARMSAELNSIIKIYEGRVEGKEDFHLLLSTDTWLGEETARLVRLWLEARGMTVDVHRQVDLQTEELTSFQLSLSELIKKFSEEIPNYAQSGYTIIFNLTGGFKGVQGFLQSIAHFYADETVYIFERSSELLRIPRLPIRLDALKVIKDNIILFRQLALKLKPDSDLASLSKIFLFEIDGEITFSPWGELIWEQSKKDLYREQLWPPPTSKIRYSEEFRRSIAPLEEKEKDRLILINERIDQLAVYLHNNQINPRSLDFKHLKGNKMHPSTHEIDAWSDKDARRIFGHYENETFVLDKLDKALH